MEKVLKFLNSGVGLMILGFLVTTVGGTFLNFTIQGRARKNELSFQMFKMRLEEAKTLQADLLDQISKRSVGLTQILLYLNTEPAVSDNRKAHLTATERFWRGIPDPEHPERPAPSNYSKVKDDWNEKLVRYKSKVRVLFPAELADLLLAEDEFETEDDPRELSTSLAELQERTVELSPKGNCEIKKPESEYLKNQPKSVHGAFVMTHRTLYYLIFKCQNLPCKNWDELMCLAKKQVSYQELLIQCLSYGIAEVLLVDPYGPERKISPMPKRCEPFFRDSETFGSSRAST